MPDPFARCPRTLRASSRPDAPVYRRADDRFAVHGAAPTEWNLRVVARLAGDDIVIASGSPPAPPAGGPPGALVGPVYVREPGDEPAVPTGAVLVRFADGVAARNREPALRAAGFVIERALAYAPEALFVCSNEAHICASLEGIARLESLADVVHVEPQMLGEAARRV